MKTNADRVPHLHAIRVSRPTVATQAGTRSLSEIVRLDAAEQRALDEIVRLRALLARVPHIAERDGDWKLYPSGEPPNNTLATPHDRAECIRFGGACMLAAP